MSTLILTLPTTASTSPATATAPAPHAPLGRRIWTALVVMGQARAAAELRRHAAIYADTRPELARQLLAAANGGPNA